MTQRTDFAVHHLRFEVEALTLLLLPAHAGPSIRGALFDALRCHFCPLPARETPGADHKAICPVCWLMATENPDHGRGRDVPRPYAVEPPLLSSGHSRRSRMFKAGERFSFDLILFARALNLFPYLVVAMPLMGEAGLGVPLRENAEEGRKRRGQFVLRRVEALHPLTGETATVMAEGESTVQMPDLPVTAPDVAAASRAMLERLDAGGGEVTLCFRTPARIVEAGRLTHRPWLGPLFRRLLERLDALRGGFAGQPPVADRERLEALADGVRLGRDATKWVEIKSYSRRLKRYTWVSGFVGSATYRADPETWAALLPYLVWGQVVHVGKDTTRGDGWYEVRAGG